MPLFVVGFYCRLAVDGETPSHLMCYSVSVCLLRETDAYGVRSTLERQCALLRFYSASRAKAEIHSIGKHGSCLDMLHGSLRKTVVSVNMALTPISRTRHFLESTFMLGSRFLSHYELLQETPIDHLVICPWFARSLFFFGALWCSCAAC